MNQSRDEQIERIADICSRVDERTSLMMDMLKEFKEEQDEQDARHFKLKSRMDKWAGSLLVLIFIFNFIGPEVLKAFQGE